ncbi:hypothetical protein ACFWNG_18375 [Streptomyces sp. NPDC058391]
MWWWLRRKRAADATQARDVMLKLLAELSGVWYGRLGVDGTPASAAR